MIEKHLLVPDRVRRPPAEGFSWIDRRFLREFASRLSGDACFCTSSWPRSAISKACRFTAMPRSPCVSDAGRGGGRGARRSGGP